MKNLGIIIFMFLSTMIAAQPSAIEVQSCTTATSEANGLYARGVDNDGCPCYENDNGAIASVDGKWWYISGNTCESTFNITGSGERDLASANGCNILDSDNPIDDCVIIAANTNPIPTLSQWGLILLAFMFLIVGVVVVRQRVKVVV